MPKPANAFRWVVCVTAIGLPDGALTMPANCQFDLAPGEVLQVDTGCIVAFHESVQYDVQFAGGIATSIFGGEGLFLATLMGPGKAWVQTMTLAKLRRAKSGGGEAQGLGSLTNIFGSNDLNCERGLPAPRRSGLKGDSFRSRQTPTLASEQGGNCPRRAQTTFCRS